VDDTMRAECREFEEIAKVSRENNRKANPLGEPSNRANASTSRDTARSSASNPAGKLPKLTEAERRLLFDNEGCLKCRKFFVNHKSMNCPNAWPSASGYRTLSQADVDRTRNASKGKAVVAVGTVNENDAPEVHPVAMVLRSSKEPAAYMPANTSSVIEQGNDSVSDNSVSTPLSAEIPKGRADGHNIMLKADDASLYIPHLHWKCEVQSGEGAQPWTIEARDCHELPTDVRKSFCLFMS